MTDMPENFPMQFQEDYYKNCEERDAFKESRYTIQEYWKIWSSFTNYIETEQ
jgi:hypothetical protein